MLFGTNCQSMYFMSTIFSKDRINGFRVTQYQTSYIRDTTNSSQKIWLSCVEKYIICSWELIFGTTGVGGSHKVLKKNNNSYYYVSSK